MFSGDNPDLDITMAFVGNTDYPHQHGPCQKYSSQISEWHKTVALSIPEYTQNICMALSGVSGQGPQYDSQLL